MVTDVRDFLKEAVVFVAYLVLRRSEEAEERGFEVFPKVQESPIKGRTLWLETASDPRINGR